MNVPAINHRRWISSTSSKSHLERNGDNFPDLHRVIMGFKGWLRGMHHRVEDLHAYVDEYCYRFNRSNMKDGIFDNLLRNMIKLHPLPHKIYCLNA